MKRRKFINQLGIGAAATTVPSTLLSFTPSISFAERIKSLSFGIVADVHKDLMSDADKRLESFINKATDKNLDFIIQLGDFCFGDANNKDFLNILNDLIIMPKARNHRVSPSKFMALSMGRKKTFNASKNYGSPLGKSNLLLKRTQSTLNFLDYEQKICFRALLIGNSISMDDGSN